MLSRNVQCINILKDLTYVMGNIIFIKHSPANSEFGRSNPTTLWEKAGSYLLMPSSLCKILTN